MKLNTNDPMAICFRALCVYQLGKDFYIQKKNYDDAISNLTKALETTKKRTTKIRFIYVYLNFIIDFRVNPYTCETCMAPFIAVKRGNSDQAMDATFTI